MRVYKRKRHVKFSYPEQMEQILNYLNEHGEILVEDWLIESLYREFSDERYCAGWMGINDGVLEEFEDWLYYYDR